MCSESPDNCTKIVFPLIPNTVKKALLIMKNLQQ